MTVWIALGVALILLAVLHVIPLVVGLIVGLVTIAVDAGPRFRGRGPWGR